MALYRHLLTFAACLLPLSVFALYNGSPTLPEMPEQGLFLSKDAAISFKAGYEGNFLFGRNINMNESHITGMLNAASLTLGFINRVEVYSLLGSTKTEFSFVESGQKIKIKTGNNFGGEVGIRANTPIWGDLKFGADAKYFYAWPTLQSIKVEGQAISPKGNIYQKEWQVGIAVAQTFGFISPYAGVKFSRFRMKVSNAAGLTNWISSRRVSIYNQCPFGFFVGLGFAGRKGVYFDLEARFVDEYGVTGALGLSF